MSQVKNRCFKAIHIPFENKYELESDHTSFINESANMGNSKFIINRDYS